MVFKTCWDYNLPGIPFTFYIIYVKCNYYDIAHLLRVFIDRGDSDFFVGIPKSCYFFRVSYKLVCTNTNGIGYGQFPKH